MFQFQADEALVDQNINYLPVCIIKWLDRLFTSLNGGCLQTSHLRWGKLSSKTLTLRYIYIQLNLRQIYSSMRVSVWSEVVVATTIVPEQWVNFFTTSFNPSRFFKNLSNSSLETFMLQIEKHSLYLRPWRLLLRKLILTISI